MKRLTPPALLQLILLALVPTRDAETIGGDMMEAYAERQRCAGRAAANAWYARQVVSFLPHSCAIAYRRAPVLVSLCCFTALCGLWLGTMDVVLGHSHLALHEAIAGLIVGQGLLTMLALPLRGVPVLRWCALLGALAVTYLGGSALWATLHSRDTEGYILLISVGLDRAGDAHVARLAAQAGGDGRISCRV